MGPRTLQKKAGPVRCSDTEARCRRPGGWRRTVAGDEVREVVGHMRHHRDRAALVEREALGGLEQRAP